MEFSNPTITVNGLRFYAYHGVDPQERIVGCWFRVDLTIELDATQAINTDQLEGTVSYATAAEIASKEMAIPSKLIEHVAGRIAKSLLESLRAINRVTVSVSKENPPLGIPCTCSAFTLTATK